MFQDATQPYKSREIAWTNGRDHAIFDLSFVPPRGPNGGINVVRSVTVHAILNMTIADAVGEGEDAYRFIRNFSATRIDGSKAYDEVTGDTLRNIGYAHNGAARQHEHQDLAIAATTDRKFSALVPFAKPFAFDPDDYGIPSELLKEIRVGMAIDTDFELGATTCTIHSGTYWLVADVYEQMSVVLPSQDCWRQVDLTSTTQEQADIFTGGRMQDLYLYVPGLGGGQTLANLSEAGYLHGMDVRLLKDPDLKQRYARARGASYNSFSAVGSPLRSDPFCAADSGTLRALAIALCNGHKAFNGVEREREQVRLKVSAALPAAARLVCRFTQPVSDALDQTIRRNHDVNAFYFKTKDKTMRDPGAWARQPRLAAYLPRKYIKLGAKGQRVR